MKFHYAGKYSGNPEDLPTNTYHEENYVPFKEPKDAKSLAIIANIIALVLYVITLGVFLLRGSFYAWNFWGILISFICLIPHEFLHAICFKEDVYMYTYLSKGMLFVIGPERMTKKRFIFMSLLPNIVFGFVPFLLFIIFPFLKVLGMLGAFSIPMGAGDYINVFNAITQMPKGAYTYLHCFNSYWYIPKQISGTQ